MTLKMRRTLRMQRELLERKRDELNAGLLDFSDLRIDPAAEELDRRLQAAEREISVAAKARASALLREVKAALERLDNRSYGACEDCRQQIPDVRLRAIPWVRRCIDCQEEADQDATDRAGAFFAAA